MAIIGEVHIKVEPMELRSKAQLVSDNIRKMQERFDELERIISRTSYYWIGEAGELHRKMYTEQIPNIEEMMKRLSEHPTDLMTMAQVYETTESAVRDIGAELPGDIIS